jgi:hypothetical protein
MAVAVVKGGRWRKGGGGGPRHPLRIRAGSVCMFLSLSPKKQKKTRGYTEGSGGGGEASVFVKIFVKFKFQIKLIHFKLN